MNMFDACAFQDGHIDYDELDAFFSVNKKLADKYGMQCWTNAESSDPGTCRSVSSDQVRRTEDEA